MPRFQKPDHYLILTKLRCIKNKSAKYGKTEIGSSSGIYKTIYHDGFYLFLLGTRKLLKVLQSLEILNE